MDSSRNRMQKKCSDKEQPVNIHFINCLQVGVRAQNNGFFRQSNAKKKVSQFSSQISIFMTNQMQAQPNFPLFCNAKKADFGRRPWVKTVVEFQVGIQKSVNLQCKTLVCWDARTRVMILKVVNIVHLGQDKGLIDQASDVSSVISFFTISCKILSKIVSIYFLVTRIKSFE